MATINVPLYQFDAAAPCDGGVLGNSSRSGAHPPAG
jgi:hypothetical protein